MPKLTGDHGTDKRMSRLPEQRLDSYGLIVWHQQIISAMKQIYMKVGRDLVQKIFRGERTGNLFVLCEKRNKLFRLNSLVDFLGYAEWSVGILPILGVQAEACIQAFTEPILIFRSARNCLQVLQS